MTAETGAKLDCVGSCRCERCEAGCDCREGAGRCGDGCGCVVAAPGQIFPRIPAIPSEITVKVQVPGLDKAISDAAYDSGVKMGGGAVVAVVAVAILAALILKGFSR